MEMLISTLQCGKIQLVLNQSAVYYLVVKFQDVLDKIIPLFDQYPIQGIKGLDFADFKKVANLMCNKKHFTKEGLSEISEKKLNMHLVRTSTRKIN